MQKKIIALAVAGLVSGGAFAQSTVTVYGVVDQALDMGSHGNGTKSRMVGSGYATERIGFKGEEALGNGMTAFFNLEAGMGSTAGTVGGATVAIAPIPLAGASSGFASATQLFSREAKIGVKGKFGEVAFGRLYSPWFTAWSGSDAFGVAGAGSNYSLQRNQTTRVNNSMMYSTPAMGGFSASLMYGTGDVGGAEVRTTGSALPLMASTGGADNTTGNLNKNVGRHVALNLRYANGPVAVAYGYAKTDAANTTAAGGLTLALVGAGTPAQLKQNTLTGSYDFGVAKLFANWSTNQNDVETAKTVDNRVWSLGLTAPVGPGVVRVQFGQTDNKLVADTDSKLAAVGYVYPMSKRTTLYTTYAKVSNKNNGTFSYLGDGTSSTSSVGVVGNGATAAGTSNVGPSTLQLGVSHSF